jgi:DNA-binding response OmpR family regulator
MKKRLQKKVLIVDDEVETCKFISAYFSRHKDCKVYEAYDGAQAFDAIQKIMPDLIILDVIMPAMDGFQLLQKLKEDPRYSQIPVIILTVKSKPEDLGKGIALKADFYLPKPFSLDNLMSFAELILEN